MPQSDTEELSDRETELQTAWDRIPEAFKLDERDRATFGLAWRLAWETAIKSDEARQFWT